MKVSELAEELGLPPSAVLEQCQRFGITAGWAGAELNGTDVVILRAELADADEPLDLTAADPPAEAGDVASPPAAEAPDATERSTTPETADPPGTPPEPAKAPAGEKRLPPTAAGSIPELIDEITPEPAEPVPAALGDFRLAGREGDPDDPEPTRRVPPRPAPESKHFERAARNALIALAVGAAALGGSTFVGNPWAIAGLWLLGAIALVVALVDGNRGRRRVTTHPERLQGLWISVAVMVLAAAGLAGTALAVATVVGDDEAADAPLGVGEVDAVADLRWGYQRLLRIADNGWKRPAKDPGTCWEVSVRVTRPDDRNEFGTRRVDCEGDHTVEVIRVFAYDRDADAPFPGTERIAEAVRERCGELVAELPAGVQLLAEHPTEDGWGRGDHDVACVLVGPERSGSLVE